MKSCDFVFFSSSWNRLFVLIFSVVRTNHSAALLDIDCEEFDLAGAFQLTLVDKCHSNTDKNKGLLTLN